MLLQNRAVRNSKWSMICTSSIVIIRSPSEIALTVPLTVTVKQQVENRVWRPEDLIRMTANELIKLEFVDMFFSNQLYVAILIQLYSNVTKNSVSWYLQQLLLCSPVFIVQ